MAEFIQWLCSTDHSRGALSTQTCLWRMLWSLYSRESSSSWRITNVCVPNNHFTLLHLNSVCNRSQTTPTSSRLYGERRGIPPCVTLPLLPPVQAGGGKGLDLKLTFLHNMLGGRRWGQFIMMHLQNSLPVFRDVNSFHIKCVRVSTIQIVYQSSGM